MTYAPPDLLAVQRYARAKTGQAWTSLGIVGDTSHNSDGGYHVGRDVLHALGTAPEDPGSDYSYVESQRDRAGLTNGASAFDLGGSFPRFKEFNAWIVGRARGKDPRCRDIREIIHTPDGRTVRRWDALGIRSSGDSSHLSHTHFSFFRDSEGRRDRADNFLGLLTDFFDGPTEVPDMNLSDGFMIPTWGDSEFTAPEPTTVKLSLSVAQRRSYQAWRGTQAVEKKVDTVADGVAELKTALAELRATPPGSVAITDEQLQAVAEQVKTGILADLAPLLDIARKIENG